MQQKQIIVKEHELVIRGHTSWIDSAQKYFISHSDSDTVSHLSIVYAKLM